MIRRTGQISHITWLVFTALTLMLAVPATVRGQHLTESARTIAIPLPAGDGVRSHRLYQGGNTGSDRLWNGMLIGAGVGAFVGMVLAPPAFCGRNDSECATIVRVAIGLPSIAGGIGAGALVDWLMK
jgi:hypothetical protein